MRRRLQLGACVALVAVVLSGCWGQVGYDAGHTRFNSVETALSAANAPTLAPSWTVGLNAEATEPMIRSGRVFLTTWTDGVIDARAISIADGTTAWNHRFTDLTPGATAFATPSTFVGDELWSGYLAVINSPRPVGAFAAPARLNPVDGSIIAQEQNILGSAAIEASGSVVQNWWTSANSLGQVVRVRDAETLATTWEAHFARDIAVGEPQPYPMAVAAGRLYVVDHTGMLHMFPLAGCGAAVCPPTWSRDIGIAATLSQPLALGDQVIITEGVPGNPDEGVYRVVALDGDTGSLNWANDAGAAGTFVDQDLAATPDTVFAVAPNFNRLYAFDMDNCCQQWHADLGSAPTAAPTAAVDAVYVGVAGAVQVYGVEGCDTQPCSPIATIPVDGTPEHIVVADGKLFVVHHPAGGGAAQLTAFAPATP